MAQLSPPLSEESSLSPSPPYMASPTPSPSPTTSPSPDRQTTSSAATIASNPTSSVPSVSPTNQTAQATADNGVFVAPVAKYTIASHSLRLTKFGYAIEPVELGYPEIIRNLSSSARRLSDYSFSSSQVGHKVLALIRGFWSQPGFPAGKQTRLPERFKTVKSILDEFSRYPVYPHKDTYGKPTKERPERVQSAGNRLKQRQSPRKGSNKADVSKPSPSTLNLGRQAKSLQMTLPNFATVSTIPETTNDEVLNRSIRDKFVSFSPSPPPHDTDSDHRKPSARDLSDNSIFALFARASKNNPSRPKGRSSSTSSSNSSSSPPLAPLPNDLYYTWIPREKEPVFELITRLCSKMEKLFAKEPRILQIESPCTVMGDIHGNLTDLRTYERALWPRAPVCVSSQYLFLGDYVDRGDYSVECVLYLFAMKLIAPQRFFLLRGNHEVAAIQKQYTFGRECELKFGSFGRQLWRSFNKVFDLMPIAAIIDKQIFCAHGGIPKTQQELKVLAREIPKPLDNPEIQCPSAWEILWNDPITDAELVGMIEMDNAVVTQMQTIQTQPGASGALVTETHASTSISTEQKPSESGSGSGAAKEALSSRQVAALSEADAILTREPPGALSFYIRPASDEPGSTKKEARASQQAERNRAESNAAAPNAVKDTSEILDTDASTKLRKVPSDTSSIASSSPQQIINDGFIANIKRGTAYLFSDQAINNFLKLNRLSHVIRAHEVIPTGFAFHGDGRVLTIFSSSKYCGLNNQAACALVGQRRIRILRLDTGEVGE